MDPPVSKNTAYLLPARDNSYFEDRTLTVAAQSGNYTLVPQNMVEL